MTKSKSTLTAVLPLTLADFVVQVAEHEAIAASGVAGIKELTAVKNTAKVNAYAHTVAGLVDWKVRKDTAQALIERGVSKSCAKRYLENGQKAKALPWVKAAGSDVDAILQAFADNDVKTEQDLVNIVCPKPVLTAAEELAAKAQTLTDSDDDAVQALLDAAALLKAAQVPLDIAA